MGCNRTQFIACGIVVGRVTLRVAVLYAILQANFLAGSAGGVYYRSYCHPVHLCCDADRREAMEKGRQTPQQLVDSSNAGIVNP